MGKKNKNKIPLIRFTDIENTKITAVKLPDEVLKVLGIDKESKREDYGTFLIEHLTEPVYRQLMAQFAKHVHDSMPKEIKAKCKFCSLEDSTKDEYRICNGYLHEAKINFFLIGNEFYRIYCLNKKLLNNKEQVKRLCFEYFSCFSFHKGLVYFNMDNLLNECLKEGLKSISEVLEASDMFRRLKIINTSLNDLNKRQIEHQIDHQIKDEYIKFQIKHFKEAKRFYKENEEIESKYKSKGNPLQNIWLSEAKL